MAITAICLQCSEIHRRSEIPMSRWTRREPFLEGHDCPHCYGVLLQMCAHFYFSTEISRLSARPTCKHCVAVLFATWQRRTDLHGMLPLPLHYSSRTYREGPCILSRRRYCNNPQLCPAMHWNETIQGSNSGRRRGRDNAIQSLYSTTLIGICWVKAHDRCYLCDCRYKSRQDVS